MKLLFKTIETNFRVTFSRFQTTISGVKQLDEYSTAVISESATEHYQIIKEDENKIKVPITESVKDSLTIT